MKIIILVLALFVFTAFSHELEEYTWTGFKRIHNRTYVGMEEVMREKIFANNLQYIEEFNTQGYSYQLGVNQFADLTNLEYRQMVLGFDNKARLEKKPHDQHHVCSMHVDDLPASVDWRTKGLVTPVKNQGQCGSCWSFSATGSLEGQSAKKNGNLKSFSEQELVDCSTSEGNHGCQGGLMDYAFEYLEKKADESEADYPYEARNGKCRYDSSKGIVKVSSYHDIKEGSLADLKDAAATVGPISVAMDASHTSFQLYRKGLYDPFFCSTRKLDHGVLVVGYGTDNSDDYWLVKNSWGKSWGDDGYFKIVQKGNKCGLATSASYPAVV